MKTNHKEEINATRIGGFGGSDAAMFLKVGRKGIESLSNSDKKRIAVALGQVEYKHITENSAMKAGHDFEDLIASMGDYVNYECEHVMRSDIVTTRNFKILAHADFWSQSTKKVVECKYSQNETEKVRETYNAQLQWYYMLGAKRVELVHGSGDVFPFNPKEINNVFVYKNPQDIADLLHGIELIDAFCDTFKYENSGDWEETDLLPFEQEEVIKLRNTLQKIKALEDEAAEFKAKLLELFRANGIKSLKSDEYSITYVPESTTSTFDKSAFAKAHHDINLNDFNKTSKKSDYLKITLK